MADSPRTRRSDSTDATTATSLTAAGMAAFLLWVFGMIDAGHFFVPPTETAMFLGAGLLPLAKALGHRWLRDIEREKPGINGGPSILTSTGDIPHVEPTTDSGK